MMKTTPLSLPMQPGSRGLSPLDGTSIFSPFSGHLTLRHARPAPGTGGPDRKWLERLLRTLAESVDLIHRANRVHLAISPDSVVFSPDGQPALLGQGVTLAAQRRELPAERAANGRNSPRYVNFLAPEQLADPAMAAQGQWPPGPWSDVYALAAVAYFALTGKAPAAPRPGDTPRQPYQATPPDVADSSGRQFETVWRGIEQGLAFDPRQRPRDVAALMLAVGLPERRRTPRGRSESLLMCDTTFNGLATIRLPQANAHPAPTAFADTQWLSDGLDLIPAATTPATPAGQPAASPTPTGANVAGQPPTPLARAALTPPPRPARRTEPRRMASDRTRHHRPEQAPARPRSARVPRHFARLSFWLLTGLSATSLVALMATVVTKTWGQAGATSKAQQSSTQCQR